MTNRSNRTRCTSGLPWYMSIPEARIEVTRVKGCLASFCGVKKKRRVQRLLAAKCAGAGEAAPWAGRFVAKGAGEVLGTREGRRWWWPRKTRRVPIGLGHKLRLSVTMK